MPYSRRQVLGAIAGGVAAKLAAGRSAAQSPRSAPPAIPPGPFQGTRESLQAYQVPDWYRDAKFGIWAHWGPQSAAEFDDWYARRMYIPGEPQYEYHCKTYGHPSKVGFKDVADSWKAAQFDADRLVELYKNAGAKYFCSMAVHHDNFDLWNSRHQPRWNSVVRGPKKDIVALFRDAARRHGLKFAVSEHLSNSFTWFAPAHLSDPDGPHAGVPYDGADPRWAELYHDYSQLPADFAKEKADDPMSRGGPDSWTLNYYQRMIDLVDQHQPDLLYTDGGIPFGQYGLNLLAHLYNASAARNGGVADAVYTSKSRPDAQAGICVLDVERGVVDGIWPAPWQTDTCIGNWHYHQRVYQENRYKTARGVIEMLVDIVSRNGNLMLNFHLPNSGALEDKELAVLDGITRWMAVNSEGIYATRPYKILGAGPALDPGRNRPRGRFQESGRRGMSAEDVRFTTKGDVLYAFVMAWPGRTATIPSLATGAAQGVGKIQKVELLGGGKLPFEQTAAALSITLPETPPCEHAIAFKITGAVG
ncbi:MAG TPA: alpha-L-fucosidase [Lacipirellulaceae bacterium]|nr:alpha-L-fucosidase [Lacipirellulaceae bacterium]